jgi:hypothetical protein
VSTWSEWQIAQFNECLIRGIGPDETAALLGRTKEEIFQKAQEMGLLSLAESPSTAPDEPTAPPKRVAAS